MGDSIKIRDELQLLFEKIPPMISNYENHVPFIGRTVKHWFGEAEKVLQNHQMPQVAELAGMRGCITAAEQGVRDDTFQVEQNVRQSKAAPAIAVITLKKAQDVLQAIIEPINYSLNEAKKLIHGIVIIAAQLNIIAQYSDPDGELTVSVRELWESLATHDNIREALSRVLTIVSYNDAIFLMKECIDELPLYLTTESSQQLPDAKKALITKTKGSADVEKNSGNRNVYNM